MKELLKIENLTVDFFSEKTLFTKPKPVFRAVDSLNLTVHPGEFAALVGESGSGKTITSLSIMNLLPENAAVTDGKISFNGKNKSIIFQEPLTCLNPLIKAGKQIEEALTVKGASKEEAHKKAVKLAELAGFSDIERIFNCYPHELSGGQRQRIMIASALMTDPELLIADEPTTALDVSTQKEILNILFDLKKEFNTALLLITHDFSIVKKICTYVYIMYRGKIVEEGPVEKIFTSPEHPYTKALINSIPYPSRRSQRLPSYFEQEWQK
jgi:ABC-type dipeptide/oligopeptide/nickel transport system ATPase component